MISPFSINLEKAMVPMKESIAKSKIISRKKLVSTRIENSPTKHMRAIPNASNAMTLSDGVGPFTTRKSKAIMDNAIMTIAVQIKYVTSGSPPILPFQRNF